MDRLISSTASQVSADLVSLSNFNICSLYLASTLFPDGGVKVKDSEKYPNAAAYVVMESIKVII